MHFLVAAPGYEPLVTHVFIGGDPNIDCDVVFGVKDELIATIEKRSDADARRQAGGFALAPHDLRVQDEAGRRSGTETARSEGHGRRLSIKRRHCPILVRRTRIGRMAHKI